MASRHQRTASIGEYIPFHIGAFQASKTGLPTSGTTGQPAMDLGHGVFLGTVILNDPGSATVFTIFNGASGPTVAIIKPSTNVTLNFECVLDQGFYYTYTGTTVGSVTITALPCAV